MVRFINKITGTDMWVAEDRAEEYKAAGHIPAAAQSPTEDEQPERTPVKKKTKK